MAKRSSRSRLRSQRIYRARKSAYSSFSRAYESERSRWTEKGKKIFSPIKYSTFRSEITSLMENEDFSAGEALRSVKSKVNKYITYLKEFRERQDKFEEQMNEEEEETNDGELELLASTPLSELNRSQLKKYAAFLGVDLTGVTSVKEARERVKAKLDEE